MPWKRPENIQFPSTWLTFTSPKTNRSYWIQDIPDEYKEIVANYMVYRFTKEEILFQTTHDSTYPEFLTKAKNLWTKNLSQNVGLICLTRNTENDKIQIAGFNCLAVDCKGEKLEHKDMISKVMRSHCYLLERGDAFNKLNDDVILMGFGLYVLPEFRGENVGLELLKARQPLCAALGIKTTCTVFSSRFSQNLAERAGFKDLYAIDYEALEEAVPEFAFPGAKNHTKSARYMYKVY